MMADQVETTDSAVGVVGLGLMGSSIVVALLIAGHRVRAVTPLPEDREVAPGRITDQLLLCAESGLLREPVDANLARLTISEDYHTLAGCSLVLECVIEKIEIKEAVYRKITAAVAPHTIIGSNTSAIPISTLQHHIDQPERFLGIHWAEPAYTTRFLEITCGHRTAQQHADRVFRLAHAWGKEPTLLRKDIRGFITNRLMYAVYREAFHLVENGTATVEDVDKAFRYDAGSWMTLMGIFRRMDFLGLADYAELCRTLFPQLSNADQVPALMQRMVEMNARGTQNQKGLYPYTEEEARHWDEAFAAFNQEIFRLAARYPADPTGSTTQHRPTR